MIRCLLALLQFGVAAIAFGDDGPAKSATQVEAKRRLEFMQGAFAECRVAASELADKSALKLGKTPLLRYDDPTRGLSEKTEGLMDASVWRMGETGRPTALITLEIYRVGPMRAILSYEFLSLTPSPLELNSPRGPKWTPSGTDLKLVPLPGAAAPADSPRARLTQMRQLARRFAVQEELSGNKIECRLLAQPIDRYAGGPEKLLDGAIFAFANGTNPEVGLLLECTEKGWSYGICRLSSAALFARLDDKQIWEAPKVKQSGALDSYAGMGYPIEWAE